MPDTFPSPTRFHFPMPNFLKQLPIVAMFLSAPLLAWEDVEKELPALNPDIRHIWSGGNWQHRGKEGFFRLIVAGGGYEHYKAKLYVQWIDHGSDMEGPKLLKTVGIAEINDSPVYAFELPECKGDWKCDAIRVEAIHTYESSRHVFEIEFTGIGQYRLKHNVL